VVLSNPADWDKTLVRIDEKDMQVLGVKSGEIVTVSGLRCTAAVCLPLETQPKQWHTDIIYHDEQSKRVPPIQLANIICNNIRGGNVGELVEVRKAEAVRAEKLVLGTIQDMFPYSKENLAMNKLDGLIVSKGDRIDVYHHDSQNRTPFQVLDGTPLGNIYTIVKETKMEFAEISRETMQIQNPKLDKLIKVIPVVRQIQVKEISITIPSIEIYDNGTRFIFYLHQKLSQNQQPFSIPILRPNIKVTDDLGNSYKMMGFEGQGGHGDMESFRSSESAILVPSFDPKARELKVAIQEMVWQKMRSISQVVSSEIAGKKPENRYHMTPAQSTFEIVSGPWEFTIPLK
jgi:hypothetical protein